MPKNSISLRLATLLAFACALPGAWAVSPPPATWPAGNTGNGKALYTAACTTSGCHSGTSNGTDNLGKVGNGAGNPARINTAILNGTMTNSTLRALTAQQIADIAAYLANPNATTGAPAAGVSASMLSFASTTIGAGSGAQTVTLTNSGTAPLVLTAVTSSSAAVFGIGSGTCAAGASLAPSGTCTVAVSFYPTAVGAVAGTLTIAHNANPATTAIALSGSGVAAPAPLASVMPSSLSFTQVTATTSASQTVTVANTGTAPLSLGTIAIGGAQASDFARASTGTCGTAAIAPGSNCSITIAFTPAAIGVRSASLSIAHNATGSPAAVALNGVGTASPQPVVSVNGNALNFASQVIGAPATQTLTLTNSGQAVLVLSAVTVSGTNAAEFVPGGTCVAGVNVPVGQTCSLNIRFTPTLTGTRSASVAIVSNAATASIGLSGTAIAAPAPVATLAPTTVAFGTASIGATAISRTLTLTNSGTGTLSLVGIGTSGLGFASTSTCGASLAPAAQCVVTMTFAPPGAGAFSGSLSVASNAAGSPGAVALTGSGVLAPVAVLAWTTASSPPVFAGTAVGSVSPAVVLDLVNQGPGVATLASVSAGTAEFPLAGTCVAGMGLAMNATCTVNVAFAPAQAGTRSGSLVVKSSGADPVAVPLAGNGVAAARASLALSSTSLVFPPVSIGSAGNPMTLTLNNSGTADIQVSSLPSGAGLVTATPTCGALPIALVPGRSCAIDIALSAGASAAPGPLVDTITVVTDVAGAPTVHISASVTAAAPVEMTNVGAGSTDATLLVICATAMALLALLVRRRKGPARIRRSRHHPQGDLR